MDKLLQHQNPVETNRPRNPEQIKKSIAVEKELISENVDKIKQKFREMIDWRSHMSQHLFLVLGTAAGLGYLASFFFKRRVPPGERLANAINRMAKRTNVQRQNAIHAAVVGIATKTATDWLKAKTLQRKPSQGIRKLQGSNPHSEHEQSRLVVNKEECRALANPEEAGAKKPSEDVESRPIPEIG